MVELDGYRVVASAHAIEKARRRIPVLRGADVYGGRYWVEQTVARALRDGRRASNCPRWALRGNERPKAPKAGVTRFFWNETLTACFVAMQVKSQGHGRVWLVKTVFAPIPA